MLAKARRCSFLHLVKDSGPKGLTMLLNLKREIYKDFWDLNCNICPAQFTILLCLITFLIKGKVLLVCLLDRVQNAFPLMRKML